MKKRIMMLIFMSLSLVSALFADENPFFRPRIKNEVVWLDTATSRMRDTCLTNVFHSLTTNGFVMTNLTERITTKYEIEYQGVRFPFEDGYRTRFSLNYYTASVASFDKVSSGQAALMYVVNINLRSSMPPWYEQYMEGPGNICLINFRADVSKSLDEVLFCRDNVAVHVRSFFGDDCLAFARLLDECILASSISP